MPSISSFYIISNVLPDPKIFLCIPSSASDAAAVNPNGINTLLANSFSKKAFLKKPFSRVILQHLILKI